MSLVCLLRNFLNIKTENTVCFLFKFTPARDVYLWCSSIIHVYSTAPPTKLEEGGHNYTTGGTSSGDVWKCGWKWISLLRRTTLPAYFCIQDWTMMRICIPLWGAGFKKALILLMYFWGRRSMTVCQPVLWLTLPSLGKPCPVPSSLWLL